MSRLIPALPINLSPHGVRPGAYLAALLLLLACLVNVQDRSLPLCYLMTGDCKLLQIFLPLYQFQVHTIKFTRTLLDWWTVEYVLASHTMHYHRHHPSIQSTIYIITITVLALGGQQQKDNCDRARKENCDFVQLQQKKRIICVQEGRQSVRQAGN